MRVGKLTSQERELAQKHSCYDVNKAIPDTEIIEETRRKTNKKLSRIRLYYLRRQINLSLWLFPSGPDDLLKIYLCLT